MARGLSGGNYQGAFDKSAQSALVDCDAFESVPIVLTGSADVINPHVAGNYIVNTAGVDAMSLAAPTAGVDDNLTISIYSNTLNAHTVTATSLFANGTALKTTATFAAFQGAGLSLRAYAGVWQVIGSTAVTFT